LFGVVFAPSFAKASFLSSLFGNDASASTLTGTLGSVVDNNNSQNMPILQSNGFAVSTLEDKQDKSPASTNSVNQNADVNILADSALVPATGPLGVSDGTNSGDPSNDQTSVYVVRAGDSLSEIAQMFGVSVNTILLANDMKKGDVITEGQVLVILPISGIEHTVTKGETVASITKFYKVGASDIARYNGIAQNAQLAVGDQLLIPNADSSESDQPVKDLNASIAKDIKYYQTHSTKVFAGYYIDPVPGYELSQGIHDNNAVDLAIGTGTPIHAAASGTVLIARYGYNGGFGNFVVINHPNGTQTLYAHQSRLNTTSGAQVSQGQVIGYVGSTGRSTGPHLHFEVHGARNPGVDGSWAD
jgi:LysM repeat protein